MKKILGLSIVAILVLAVAGVGTWALFSDTEKSTGNILTAGTLDLKTNDADGVTGTFTATGIKPGDYIPATAAVIALRNAGSINGSTCNITFGYVEADGSAADSVPLTANQFAAGLTITNLSYAGSSLLGSIFDANVNGRVDMYDLAQSTALQSLSGLDAGAPAKNFTIQVRLDPSADNSFQNDGINVTVTFILTQ